MSTSNKPDMPEYVVGIGASAGGLQAIEQFFDSMPCDSGMAFVVVQHLSPDFKSMMDELLRRHTQMNIFKIEDEMRLEPDSIYLVPPRQNLTVTSGVLRLVDVPTSTKLNLPIDVFLHSLAEDLGPNAIAAILSGSGSDGSRGVQAVHHAGGLVLVEDAANAKFDGMPCSALATKVVDRELPPGDMPAAILDHIRQVDRLPPDQTPEKEPEDDLAQVFSLLNERFSIDFASYKPTTIHRRIGRRLTLQRCSSLGEYLTFLRQEPRELEQLYVDLLIGVTGFFRDHDAFHKLEKEVCPRIFENADNNAIRVWVAGCATGEEAYSLAMVLEEINQRRETQVDIKLFATDVHEASLHHASCGIYDEMQLKEVSQERRQRYFSPVDGGMQISPAIRKMVIFANHNIVKNPPFTKLDLISCRNLLIYLQPPAQRKVLSMFHFALRTGGFLFLGPSEAVNELNEEFDAVDGTYRLFRKRRDVLLTDTQTISGLGTSTLVPRSHAGNPTPKTNLVRTRQRIYEEIIGRNVAPGFLVNSRRELIHVFGAGKDFLEPPSGNFTQDVLQLAREEIRLALGAAIHRAISDNEVVVYRGISMPQDDGLQMLCLTADPIVDKALNETYVHVTLTPIEAELDNPTTDDEFDVGGESSGRFVELERELVDTKEHLQAAIEELETSNEELQSTNEELVAANEELQSTNEELHSVNEELYTVNSEHQSKIEELLEVTSDLNNLLKATEIGTVFLDDAFCIRKFTPAIQDLIHLQPQDIGRPLAHISHKIDLGESKLLDLLRQVVERDDKLEREVTTQAGQRLLMRILPYRDSERRVSGGVISFVDFSEIHHYKRELTDLQQRLSNTLASARIGTWEWVIGSDTVTWDEHIFRVFGMEPDAKQKSFEDVRKAIHPEDVERFEAEVNTALASSGRYESSFRIIHPDGSIHWIHSKGSVLCDPDGSPERMLGICWDETGQAETKREKEQLAAIVASSEDAIISTTLDGIITVWNQGATKLYGYAATDVIGQPSTLLVPEHLQDEHREFRQRILANDHACLRTVRKRKDGTLVAVSITACPLPGVDGEIVGLAAIARDITAIVKAESELEATNLRLSKINAELEQFSYVASHDLREPLRTVRSFCEMFQNRFTGQIDETADKWIGFMIDGTNRMQALIDSLLEYSRLGRAEQPLTCFPLDSAVQAAMGNLQAGIRHASAAIRVGKLPTIRGDEVQLVQLFQNLISNSLKYAGEDPPRIEISSEQNSTGWTIRIEDNGIGISPKFHKDIFEPFRRLHDRRDYPGTGMGLAICRKIVELHEGSIWVDSNSEHGTTFAFTIPRQTSGQENRL